VNVLTPPAELVGVAPPHWLRGYADSPDLAAWLALPPGGRSTVAQRNAVVAQLAWCLSFLARPTQDVRLVNGVPFPYGVTPNGSSLVLGAVDYVPGDVTLPTAVRAAGALPPAPVPPTPPTPPSPPAPLPPTVTVTDAQRRAAFDAANGLLYGLALRPGSVLVPAPLGAPAVAPSGYLQAAVSVALIGAGIYAAYSAYVDAAAVEAAARVQQTRIQEEERGRVIRDQVRIQEEGNTQRVTAQIQGKLDALAQRLAYGKATGTIPPESALEREPIQVQAQQQLYQWQANAPKDPASSSLAAIAGGALFGGALVGVGTAAWGRREDIQLAYGAWRERRGGGAGGQAT